MEKFTCITCFPFINIRHHDYFLSIVIAERNKCLDLIILGEYKYDVLNVRVGVTQLGHTRERERE